MGKIKFNVYIISLLTLAILLMLFPLDSLMLDLMILFNIILSIAVLITYSVTSSIGKYAPIFYKLPSVLSMMYVELYSIYPKIHVQLTTRKGLFSQTSCVIVDTPKRSFRSK